MVNTRQASETRTTALNVPAVISSSLASQPSSSSGATRISHSSGPRPKTVTEPTLGASPARARQCGADRPLDRRYSLRTYPKADQGRPLGTAHLDLVAHRLSPSSVRRPDRRSTGASPAPVPSDRSRRSRSARRSAAARRPAPRARWNVRHWGLRQAWETYPMTGGASDGAPSGTSGVPSGGTNAGSSGSRPTTLGRTPPTLRSRTSERRPMKSPLSMSTAQPQPAS